VFALSDSGDANIFLGIIGLKGFKQQIKIIIVVIVKGQTIDEAINAAGRLTASGTGGDQSSRSGFTISGRKYFRAAALLGNLIHNDGVPWVAGRSLIC